MRNGADTGDTAQHNQQGQSHAQSRVRATYGSARSRSVSLMIRFGNAMLWTLARYSGRMLEDSSAAVFRKMSLSTCLWARNVCHKGLRPKDVGSWARVGLELVTKTRTRTRGGTSGILETKWGTAQSSLLPGFQLPRTRGIEVDRGSVKCC